MTESLTIRMAYPDDREALERLATLDSRPLPAEPLLVAEVDDELWAAVSLPDGDAVADPFRPSGVLVGLLHARRLHLMEPSRKARLARVGAALRFA